MHICKNVVFRKQVKGYFFQLFIHKKASITFRGSSKFVVEIPFSTKFMNIKLEYEDKTLEMQKILVKKEGQEIHFSPQ